MEEGKSLGKRWGYPSVGTVMYPIYFSGSASGNGTCAAVARVLHDRTVAIGVLPETKIIIYRNPANFAHKRVFSENPVSTRMTSRIDRSRGLKSPPRGVLIVVFVVFEASESNFRTFTEIREDPAKGEEHRID